MSSSEDPLTPTPDMVKATAFLSQVAELVEAHAATPDVLPAGSPERERLQVVVDGTLRLLEHARAQHPTTSPRYVFSVAVLAFKLAHLHRLAGADPHALAKPDAFLMHPAAQRFWNTHFGEETWSVPHEAFRKAFASYWPKFRPSHLSFFERSLSVSGDATSVDVVGFGFATDLCGPLGAFLRATNRTAMIPTVGTDEEVQGRTLLLRKYSRKDLRPGAALRVIFDGICPINKYRDKNEDSGHVGVIIEFEDDAPMTMLKRHIGEGGALAGCEFEPYGAALANLTSSDSPPIKLERLVPTLVSESSDATRMAHQQLKFMSASLKGMSDDDPLHKCVSTQLQVIKQWAHEVDTHYSFYKKCVRVSPVSSRKYATLNLASPRSASEKTMIPLSDDAASPSAAPVNPSDVGINVTSVFGQLRLLEIHLREKEARLLEWEKRLQSEQAEVNELRAQLTEVESRAETLSSQTAAAEALAKVRPPKTYPISPDRPLQFFLDNHLDAIVALQRRLKPWLPLWQLKHACVVYVRSKAGKKAAKRNNHYREIFESEQRYVKDLTVLDQLYRGGLEALIGTKDELLTKAELDSMFKGLARVVSVNSVLLGLMEKRLAEWPQNTKIGDLFMTHGHSFKLYAEYIRNYDSALEELHRLEKRTGYKEFERGIRRQGHHGMADYLITPVQRLTRYSLLLDALLSKTPADHVDHDDLMQSVQLIQQIVSSVNSNQAHAEAIATLRELDFKISNLPHSLVQSRRYLIHEGLLADILTPKKKDYVFLFSDLVVITTQKTKSKRHNQFEFKAEIPLSSNLKIIKMPDSAAKHGFQIINLKPEGVGDDVEWKNEWIQLGWSAESDEDRAIWLGAIDKIMSQAFKRDA